MLKAVFIDYTGTIIEESGRDIQEIIMRVYQNSDMDSPESTVAYWWRLLKEFEEKSYGDSYLTEDEIVDKALCVCREEIHLEENMEELHELFQRFWMYAPAFPDTKEFFEKCPLPIYIISNNGVQYIEESMKEKGLNPAGIICGDMVRAYKPRRELFDKALEISGCAPAEAVHIGDSVSADVEGAKAAGIMPILIDRKGIRNGGDITTVHSLKEILPLLQSV